MTIPDDHDLPRKQPNGVPPADPEAGLQPPADPWMTDAPTSPIDLHPPYGDAAPLADTMPEGFASRPAHSGPGYPQPVHEPRRRERRPVRWILVGLAALAVLMISVLIVDQFATDPDGDDPAAAASTPAVAAPPSPADAATSRRATARVQPGEGTDATTSGPSTGTPSYATSKAGPAGPVVVYEVTASGSGNVGSVQFIDQDGEMIRLSGIPLPWRTSFTLVGDHSPVLLAQRNQGGDLGPVTCTVTVDGKLTDSTTARGRYAAPMC